MGEFRDRMIGNMKVRGYSPKTQKVYTGHLALFVKYCAKAVDRIAFEEIDVYQRHLVDREVSWSYFNQAVQSIRFFFRFTLPREWKIDMIPYQKKRRLLPVVLAPEEIVALLDAAPYVKHRAILMATYATGLRVSEVRSLRVEDIDSKRMTIRVRQGKGGKDRYVMLSARLLEMLRAYWREAKVKPRTWLFPGMGMAGPIHERSIQLVVRRAAERAGIKKRVTTHTLRHSFATHLLEGGTNIRVIQLLLGHRSLNSTVIYTHVAKNGPIEARSPLDDLPTA